MEILKQAKAKYKEGTTVIDLAITLMNKTLEIINNKVLTDVERVNKLIDAGAIDKLKHFSPVLVEPLKNYMTLVSTMNLLVANGHAADYSRKMILRALLKHLELKGKDDDGRRSEYILRKVNSFEKYLTNTIDYVTTIINTVTYFAKSYSSKTGGEDDQTDEQKLVTTKVSDLAGVARILKSMCSKIELILGEVKLLNKNVLKLIAKEGSYENIRTQDFDSLREGVNRALIAGGADPEAKYNLSKVHIIGGDDNNTYIGGYKTEQDLDIKLTWMETCNLDKLAMDQDPIYADFVENKLLGLFGVTGAKELEEIVDMSDNDYFENTAEKCQIDELLQRQVDAILDSGKLEEFKHYYIKHRNQYLPDRTVEETSTTVKVNGKSASALSIDDGYLKFNLVLNSSASLDDKIEYIVKYVNAILNALDLVDVHALVVKTEQYLEELNGIKSYAQLRDSVETLNSAHNSIESTRHLIFERKHLKNDIRKLINMALDDQNIITKPKAVEKPKDRSIIDLTKYLTKRQLAIQSMLESTEKNCNNRARALQLAFSSIDSLVSPDNKDPCVCKAITVIKAVTYIDVLTYMLNNPKLLKKRKIKLHEGERSEMVDRLKKIKQYIQSIDEMPKLPTVYKGKLNSNAVEEFGVDLLSV